MGRSSRRLWGGAADEAGHWQVPGGAEILGTQAASPRLWAPQFSPPVHRSEVSIWLALGRISCAALPSLAAVPSRKSNLGISFPHEPVQLSFFLCLWADFVLLVLCLAPYSLVEQCLVVYAFTQGPQGMGPCTRLPVSRLALWQCCRMAS